MALQGKHLVAEVIMEVFSVIKLTKLSKTPPLQHSFVGSECSSRTEMEFHHK